MTPRLYPQLSTVFSGSYYLSPLQDRVCLLVPTTTLNLTWVICMLPLVFLCCSAVTTQQWTYWGSEEALLRKSGNTLLKNQSRQKEGFRKQQGGFKQEAARRAKVPKDPKTSKALQRKCFVCFRPPTQRWSDHGHQCNEGLSHDTVI